VQLLPPECEHVCALVSWSCRDRAWRTSARSISPDGNGGGARRAWERGNSSRRTRLHTDEEVSAARSAAPPLIADRPQHEPGAVVSVSSSLRRRGNTTHSACRCRIVTIRHDCPINNGTNWNNRETIVEDTPTSIGHSRPFHATRQ
jgi:hypothetical protein